MAKEVWALGALELAERIAAKEISSQEVIDLKRVGQPGAAVGVPQRMPSTRGDDGPASMGNPVHAHGMGS